MNRRDALKAMAATSIGVLPAATVTASDNTSTTKPKHIVQWGLIHNGVRQPPEWSVEADHFESNVHTLSFIFQTTDMLHWKDFVSRSSLYDFVCYFHVKSPVQNLYCEGVDAGYKCVSMDLVGENKIRLTFAFTFLHYEKTPDECHTLKFNGKPEQASSLIWRFTDDLMAGRIEWFSTVCNKNGFLIQWKDGSGAGASIWNDSP